MANYKNYKDAELLESYQTALDYSGKADPALELEINNRGGLDVLMKRVDELNIHPNEIKRVRRLAFDMYKTGQTPEIIRQHIQSDILSKEELDSVLSSAIEELTQKTEDEKTDRPVLVRSLIGFIVATFVGSIIWNIPIIMTGFIYYKSMAACTLLLCSAIIRLITGKSWNNIAALLAVVLSCIFAIALGTYWCSLML